MTSSLVLAAAEAPAFLGQVTALVVGGALVAYLGFRVGLVPIAGFLLTGVLIGPEQLGIVGDRALADAAAEVGVILLLFTIGLEFSLDRLARLRRVILGGGGAQVLGATGLTTGVLVLLGVDTPAAVFTGLLVALSSTAIVLKLLADRAEMSTRHGQVTLGLLLFQDVAIVGMVLLVPVLGGDGGSALDVGGAFATAIAIVVGVLVVARRLMPKLLEVVARTCSPEVFLLTVMAVCFGTAYGTSLAGVSVSLGAFLAGLLVSESRYDQQALGDVLPLQIVFSAIFFVSVGMLLDVGFLLAHLPVVLGVALAVLAVKALTTFVAARALGESTAVAAATALVLAQIGEFSFVLGRVGADAGLSPAGLGPDGNQGFIAIVVLLMVATPALAGLGVRLGERLEPAETVDPGAVGLEPDEDARVFSDLDGHVLVSGYGRWARQVTAALQRDGVPVGVVTLSPDGAAEAHARGLPVLLGDSTRSRTLREAGLERARFLLVLDDHPEHAGRIAGVARALRRDATILVRTSSQADVGALLEAGATKVVTEQAEATVTMLGRLLARYDVPAERIEQGAAALRAPRGGGAAARGRTVVDTDAVVSGAVEGCEHAAGARDVVPSAPGCETCLREGSHWVHLRVCLTCGHVGCCDSSPGRHASRHAAHARHPVMRSAEPGEAWGWCFEHELELTDAASA